MEKKQKHISAQLLGILIPLVIAAIAVVTLLLSLQAKSVIIEEATGGLYQESRANAADISALIEGITKYYDGVADVLEESNYESDDEIEAVLALSMTEYSDMVTDSYIGFSNMDFIDGSGWTPDAGYDPTTRAWYQNGVASSEMVLGDPSLDLTTGAMVACGSRSVTLQDGRTGAMSIDIVLASISSTVAQYTPGTTGASMLLDGTSIIAHTTEDYVGTDVSEHTDDTFLQSVASVVSAGGSSDVQTITGSDGSDYFVSFDAVDGTDWTLVSYVKKSDVLSEMRRFIVAAVGLAAVIVLLMMILLSRIINRLITKPVSELTGNITRIADGDFTVEIIPSGENEIGTMNHRMHEYVDTMRHTLGEIKGVTGQLANEAANSKSVSGDLNMQADEQSRSMQQIQGAMDDMSSAVTELANHATTLAAEVGNLSEQSEVTRKTMDELVVKARDGQRDMSAVQSGMTEVADSMADMNRVVSDVGESTKKINDIIDMINEISSQTNLLSLNASIEAARAGEAGRGFAVVADEIGSLAQNSADSTKQIAEIIQDITAQIGELSKKAETNTNEINANMDAVNTAGKTFEEIFRSLDETSSIVEDMINKVGTVDEIATSMAAISEEQSASTEEVSASATHLASSAELVAENSRDVDNSASAVSDSSEKIEKLVDFFKL